MRNIRSSHNTGSSWRAGDLNGVASNAASRSGCRVNVNSSWRAGDVNGVASNAASRSGCRRVNVKGVGCSAARSGRRVAQIYNLN